MTAYEEAIWDIAQNHYSLIKSETGKGYLPKCNVSAYVERIPRGYKLHYVTAKHNLPNTHTVVTYMEV